MLSYHYGFASTRAKYAYTPPLLWAKILQSNNIIEFSCVSQHGGWGVDFTCQLGRARAYTEFVEQQLAGVDPFEVEDQNGRLSLGKISFIGNVQEIADVFVVGDFELNLATLSLSSANTEVALTVLSVSSENDENGDNIDSYSRVERASLKTSNAPVTDVEDATFIAGFNGLDTAALLDYQRYSMRLQREWLAVRGRMLRPTPMTMRWCKCCRYWNVCSNPGLR